eukprot:1572157-Ditylum_brightwellii.AAC.1
MKEALEKFWGGLLGKPSEHNAQAKWLEVEKESVAHVQEPTWTKVTSLEFEKVVKSLKNWKATGPDKGANHALCHPELLPRWMTGDDTTLLYEKGDESVAKNYRPIICLPTCYKVLTLIITNHVYDHICNNDILPLDQKGIKQKSRGCKYHLVLGKVILELTQQNKRNLSLAWIDYQKAYYWIPHSWILEVPETYKVESALCRFIEKLIPLLQTKLNLHTDNDTITTKE